MKKIFMHNCTHTFIGVLLLVAFVSFIRLLMYYDIDVDHHHETFTVVNVEQCYDGKYTVCEIDVERDRDGASKSVEVDYIVTEGQKLYMNCYYRGVEKNTRFCYTNLNPKYGSGYSMPYEELL